VRCAQAELLAGRFSAAGLAAVHAGISAGDSITAHTAGLISTGTSHFVVVQMLQQSVPGGMPANAERQLLGLLRIKNDIEYTERQPAEPQARVLVDQAARFVRWAGSVVGEPEDLA